MDTARGFMPNQPVVAAWGMGVDSTALICGESISSYHAGSCRRHLAAVQNH